MLDVTTKSSSVVRSNEKIGVPSPFPIIITETSLSQIATLDNVIVTETVHQTGLEVGGNLEGGSQLGRPYDCTIKGVGHQALSSHGRWKSWAFTLLGTKSNYHRGGFCVQRLMWVFLRVEILREQRIFIFNLC